MKIDSSAKPSLAPITGRQQAKPQPTTSPTTDAVSLSAVVGSLQGKEQMPVNAAKVNEIKEAIAQGRFKINPEAIAGSLIDTVRDLLNSQRKA